MCVATRRSASIRLLNASSPWGWPDLFDTSDAPSSKIYIKDQCDTADSSDSSILSDQKSAGGRGKGLGGVGAPTQPVVDEGSVDARINSSARYSFGRVRWCKVKGGRDATKW